MPMPDDDTIWVDIVSMARLMPWHYSDGYGRDAAINGARYLFLLHYLPMPMSLRRDNTDWPCRRRQSIEKMH